MKFINKESNGFTLIELILAMALISTILIISYNLFFSGFFIFGKQIDIVDNQSKSKQIIREISREIRRVDADNIDIEDEGRKITINGVEYNFLKDENKLNKKGSTYILGIEEFNAEKIGNELTLKIVTLANKGKPVTITSKINIRE